MELITSIAGIRQAVRAARQSGKRIGLLPTMGYLHEGHLSLMKQARQESEFLVVSIFVNPTQFGPNEDFSRYPRDLERDLALCRSVPVDALFHPSVEEVYPPPFLTSVHVGSITDTLCGQSRPGHFEGVATVVTKLLNIVEPDMAYFGQKDAQQIAVIRRLIVDLNMHRVQIRTLPTVRATDGLALSSRNVYLSPQERSQAPVLHRALTMAQSRVAAGERDMTALRDLMEVMVRSSPLASVDYVSIVDYDTLQPVERLQGKALAALAVKFGSTRLIDNCILEVTE